jgi:hypothetical protein
VTAPKLACPCCGCLTLASHGTYEICPVCFWEDDFTVDPLDDLNPNNMCLFDARANFAAWGAVDPELVHWTRPPRPDEAPEGTPHRGELPYDRWQTLPVATGIRFGWIGPVPAVDVFRDGFLLLDDGRRAGLRVRTDEDAEVPRVQPAERAGRDRDGQFDVWLEDGPDTAEVLDALRDGLAVAIVAMLPDRPGIVVWSPAREYLTTFSSSGDWGHRESRWEASPDDVERVTAWAEAELRSGVQPGDRFLATGPRSWAHHGRSPEGATVRQVHVYDLAQPLPPESPTAWPDGTRCMLAWSTGVTLPPPPSPFPSSSSGSAAAPWEPRRLDLGTTRTYGGGGHGDVRWEGSADDVERVAAWAEAQLRAMTRPGDEWAVLGPRSWVLRRRGPGGLTMWGLAVHDVRDGRPPGAPATLPPGTLCLLEWSSGSFS